MVAPGGGPRNSGLLSTACSFEDGLDAVERILEGEWVVTDGVAEIYSGAVDRFFRLKTGV